MHLSCLPRRPDRNERRLMISARGTIPRSSDRRQCLLCVPIQRLPLPLSGSRPPLVPVVALVMKDTVSETLEEVHVR